VTERDALEVDLFLVSESQLVIDGAFMFDDGDADDALDRLDLTLAGVGTALSLPGAVTETVPTLFGLAGVPGFDTTITAPAEAAAKSLRKLKERLHKLRRRGTWTLHCPLVHFRFSCRVTEECRDGQWVETRREFVGERVGKPTWRTSPEVFVADPDKETEYAWRHMSGGFTQSNAAAERRIEAAQKACGG
jgi:hypothetical protein